MKTKFTILALLFAGFFSANAQQIPNGSFDDWSTNPLAPNEWTTYEALFGMPLGLSFRDTVDKVVGPASLKLVADSIPGQPAYGVVPGLASLGSGTMTPQGPVTYGIPFAFRPDTFYFGFKYVTPGSDTAGIGLGLKKNGVYLLNNPNFLAYIPLTSQPQWGLGYLPLASYYLNQNTPDTLEIQLSASLIGTSVQGSTLHVDGVFFGYVNLPSALQEVADKLNITVYPNPATDAITITTDENVDGFKALVCDINGSIVSATTLAGNRTIINLSTLANGTYIYRVADKTGNIIRSDRFTVAK